MPSFPLLLAGGEHQVAVRPDGEAEAWRDDGSGAVLLDDQRPLERDTRANVGPGEHWRVPEGTVEADWPHGTRRWWLSWAVEARLPRARDRADRRQPEVHELDIVALA